MDNLFDNRKKEIEKIDNEQRNYVKDNDLKKFISTKIVELRLKNKQTQDILSTNAKINRSFLSEIESGKIDISINTLESICNAFGITVSNFFLDYKKDYSSDTPVLYKNFSIQIGFNYFIDISVYQNNNGKKIILIDNDYLFYNKKYGKDFYFLLDKKEENIILFSEGKKTNIKYKIHKESDNDKTLEYK